MMRRLALVLLLPLAACGGTSDVIRHNSAPTPPAWRDNTPTNPAYLYFVGAQSGAKSLEDGRQGALSAAISQVAQYIGVSIEAFGSFVQSTRASENRAEQQVNVATAGQIQGAEVADTYYESITRQLGATQVSRYDVWVLVRFPKDAADRERARQQQETQDHANNALDLYTKAKAAREGHQLAEAARLLDLAMDDLSHVGTVVKLESADFHTSHELEDAVKLARDDVRADGRRSFVVSTEAFFGQRANETIAGDSLAAELARRGFPALRVVRADSGDTQPPANAALLVQVKATVTRTGMLYGNPVCLAHVKASVVDAATQEVVAESDAEAKGIKQNERIGARDALVEAGADAAKQLVQLLLKREAKK